MALRAVTDHPKFARLKRILGLNKSCTLGYLEALWHFCGRYTPQGNIGKYTDEDIESWLEWDGESGSLIAALIEGRWIDTDKTHRLIVHDWSRHADDATKKTLGRSKLDFVSPCPDGVSTCPDMSRRCLDISRPPEPEPEPVPEPVPVNTVVDADASTSDKPKRPSRLEQEFDEDWPKFWIRVGKGSAFKAYQKARKKVSREVLMAAVVTHGPQILARANAQVITPVHPATWMNAERWTDEQQLALVRSRGRPETKQEQATRLFEERLMRELEEASEARG